MHHLCSLSPITPSSTKSCFLFNPNKTTATTTYHLTFGFNGIVRTMPGGSNKSYEWRISSMEKESDYEVDSDKAKQALSELDQQFESLSTRQINSPKIKATSIGSVKEQVKNEPPEITGSFLGYTAFVLFVFSIFYNIVFITVIKPSIDGPEEDIVVVNDVTTNYQVSNMLKVVVAMIIVFSRIQVAMAAPDAPASARTTMRLAMYVRPTWERHHANIYMIFASLLMILGLVLLVLFLLCFAGRPSNSGISR